MVAPERMWDIIPHSVEGCLRLCNRIKNILLSLSLQNFLWYKHSMQVQMHFYVYSGSAQFFECFSIQDE